MRETVLGVYYLVAFVAAYILLRAYRKGTSLGERIGRVMLATFLNIVFYSVNFLSESYLIKSIGYSLSFITLDWLVFLFYDYVIEYLGYEKRIPSIIRKCMFTAVILDNFFLLLNPFIEIVGSYQLRPFGNGTVAVLTPKTLYHAHIILLITIIVFTFLLMVRKCIESPRRYHKRYYGLMVGILLAVGANWLYFNNIIELHIDLSVPAYGILGIMMYVNTFYYRKMVNQSITREMILDYLTDPIILFDYERNLSDYNEHMAKLLPEDHLKIITDVDVFVEMCGLKRLHDITQDHEIECSFKLDDNMRRYNCNFCCMREKNDRILGYLFVFHDITSIKRAHFALEQSIIYDRLTGFYNRNSFRAQMPQWDDDRYWPVSVGVCNVNGLRKINRQYGVSYGERIFKSLAEVIRRCIGNNHYIARIEGGDIVIMFENTRPKEATKILNMIKNDFDSLPFVTSVSLEFGMAVKTDETITVGDAVDNAIDSMVRKKMLKGHSSSSSLVDPLLQTLSESDYETEEHVERTRIMAARLGKAMKLSDIDIGKLELLAVLHDIGKVAVPHHVLSKKGRLTIEERAVMQQHTIKGYRIAKSSPELGEIADCILHHHENWDGTGYPNAIQGEEIPLLARIISAVDAHDVMTHNRPYHVAISEEEAIMELRRCAGTQFDPDVIEVFAALLEREELPQEGEKTE